MGTQLLSPKKGSEPPPPIFGPCLLLPNGWMDQDGTWYGGRPRPRPHCARWGPSSPAPKKGHSAPLEFAAHVYCGQPAGRIKMALGTEVDLGLGHIVLDGDPAPSPKRGRAPNFRPIFIVNQTAGCTKMPLGMERPRGLCVRWGPKKEAEPPIFGTCLLWPKGWMDQDGIWHGGRPWSSPHCARWGHSSPPPKGDRAPIFWPMSIAAKRLDGLRRHLVRK